MGTHGYKTMEQTICYIVHDYLTMINNVLTSVPVDRENFAIKTISRSKPTAKIKYTKKACVVTINE